MRVDLDEYAKLEKRIAELEAEVKRLKGTLGYILEQATQGYPTVLSVIKTNAKAALNDEWQAHYSAVRDALNEEKP